jgi:GMP synthase (glutamine-hydrolysing)
MEIPAVSTQTPALVKPTTTDELQQQIILILDFGSQYSELIARRIRETQVYSEVVSYRTTAEQLKLLNPQGIILSGGPNSVYDLGAPQCDPAIWEMGIPVLGVCYGMQLMVQQLGGLVEKADRAEYGKAAIHIDVDEPWRFLSPATSGF